MAAHAPPTPAPLFFSFSESGWNWKYHQWTLLCSTRIKVMSSLQNHGFVQTSHMRCFLWKWLKMDVPSMQRQNRGHECCAEPWPCPGRSVVNFWWGNSLGFVYPMSYQEPDYPGGRVVNFWWGDSLGFVYPMSYQEPDYPGGPVINFWWDRQSRICISFELQGTRLSWRACRKLLMGWQSRICISYELPGTRLSWRACRKLLMGQTV